MVARRGSAWPIVDAGGKNSAATVGVHAMVTVEDEVRYGDKKTWRGQTLSSWYKDWRW